MCGLWSGMAHWSSPGRLPAGATAVAPAAARMAQARTLAAFCARAGIGARDWMLSAWILEDGAGGSLIVETLPQVWEGVERLSGRPIDPLDEAFIAGMETCGAARR